MRIYPDKDFAVGFVEQWYSLENLPLSAHLLSLEPYHKTKQSIDQLLMLITQSKELHAVDQLLKYE